MKIFLALGSPRSSRPKTVFNHSGEVFVPGVPIPTALRYVVGAGRIESHGPEYLRNVVRIITETGLRVYKELAPMRMDQVDLANAVVWIPDSKTPNGRAEVPLTSLAVEAFRRQMVIAWELSERSQGGQTPNHAQKGLGQNASAG